MARRAGKLGESVLDLTVDDSRFNAGLDKSRRTAQSFTDNLGRDVRRGIGQGLGIAGALGVAGAVSAAIGGVQQVVAGSISAAMEWESAFAGVRKTVDASPEEFAELESSIREMATELPIAATELAGLAEAAGALGIAKKDILEFTRVTAMIGTTTDVTSDQAATSLGQLSNVLGLTNDDYERFGSTLVDLGNKGASTESQILEIASRAGAGSKLIGMASDETLAWASSVANLGIEVEAGGSALQKFFLDTAKAVSEGGDKLETYAEIAGMSGAAFKRAFEEDASSALQTFLAGLGQLTQGEQLKALEDLDFNDVRITRTLLGLAGNTDNLTDSLGVASEAWEENTALAVEAGKRYGTTESKLQILGNRVNDLAITFGEELLPHLATLATWGVEQLEQFAGEAGQMAEDVGGAVQYIAGHFGDMGDEVNQLADDMERDFMEVNDAVVHYMSETGSSFEDAIEAVRLYGTGNTAALEEAGSAWERYQESIRPRTRAISADVQAGIDDTVGILEAGEQHIGTAADAAFTPISEEAAEQRGLVIDSMKAMLAGMSNLFDTDEQVREAFQSLIDRMDDPYTDAELKAAIFGDQMIAAISGALVSGSTALITDTTTTVNGMLQQIETLEPGALASGEAVPPAIRAGMDAQMSALITWLETERGIILGELTLTEAEDLGLDGLFLYAQGMKANAHLAKMESARLARSVVTNLSIDATEGGRSVANTWFNGFTWAWWNRFAELQAATSYARNVLGGSLPTAGPLKGGVASGGASIGGGWIGAVVDSIGAGMHALESQVGTVGGALNIDSLIPAMPAVDGLGAMAGAAASSGAAAVGGITNIYQLNVNGEPLVVGSMRDVEEGWDTMTGFTGR